MIILNKIRFYSESEHIVTKNYNNRFDNTEIMRKFILLQEDNVKIDHGITKVTAYEQYTEINSGSEAHSPKGAVWSTAL